MKFNEPSVADKLAARVAKLNMQIEQAKARQKLEDVDLSSFIAELTAELEDLAMMIKIALGG